MNLQETFHEGGVNRLQVSRILYWFAWFIEICAVITGLAIAVLVGMSTFEQNKAIDESGGATSFANVLIASLPFFMVSIVELAKIPAAQAMYATTHRIWKATFALVLIFLAFITFETALNGFERNFNNLNYQVNRLMTKKDELIEQKEFFLGQNEREKSLSREGVLENFEKQMIPIRDRRDQALKALSERSREITASANSEQIKAIRTKLEDLRSQREQLIARRDKEISAVQGNIAKRQDQARNDALEKKKDLETQIQRMEARLRNTEDRFEKELSDSNIFTRGGVRERFDPEIATLKGDISDLRRRLLSFDVGDAASGVVASNSDRAAEIERQYAPRIASFGQKIDQVSSELANVAGVSQKDLDRDRDAVNEERKSIMRQFDADMAVLDSKKREDLKNVNNREQNIQKNDEAIAKIEGQLSEVKAEINVKARDNQIYRLAKMFDNNAKTVADVDSNLVNLVGKIWFGSLAMVIAITGIVLALASEVVKDERNTSHSFPAQRRAFGRGIRSLALAIIRLQRRKPRVVTEIREVVKEVPVDRVVFQDKVQQVIKKEVVHVPIYTNDPSLLRKQDVPS